MSRIGLCGAGAPARETLEARAAAARANAILATIVRTCRVLVATLREIFDESAYQRFLDRGRLESSPDAYEIFRKENEQIKSRRPRCC